MIVGSDKFLLRFISTSEQIIRQKCGKSNYNLAIFSVLFPWLIGFGSVLLGLLYLPGWKAPFANTFGYLVISMFGLKRLMNAIYLKELPEDNSELKTLHKKITNDYSLVVNEITPDNMFGEKNSFSIRPHLTNSLGKD